MLGKGKKIYFLTILFLIPFLLAAQQQQQQTDLNVPQTKKEEKLIKKAVRLSLSHEENIALNSYEKGKEGIKNRYSNLITQAKQGNWWDKSFKIAWLWIGKQYKLVRFKYLRIRAKRKNRKIERAKRKLEKYKNKQVFDDPEEKFKLTPEEEEVLAKYQNDSTSLTPKEMKIYKRIQKKLKKKQEYKESITTDSLTKEDILLLKKAGIIKDKQKKKKKFRKKMYGTAKMRKKFNYYMFVKKSDLKELGVDEYGRPLKKKKIDTLLTDIDTEYVPSPVDTTFDEGYYDGNMTDLLDTTGMDTDTATEAEFTGSEDTVKTKSLKLTPEEKERIKEIKQKFKKDKKIAKKQLRFYRRMYGTEPGWYPVKRKTIWDYLPRISLKGKNAGKSSYVKRIERIERKYKLTPKEEQALNFVKTHGKDATSPAVRRMARRAARKKYLYEKKMDKVYQDAFTDMQHKKVQKRLKKQRREVRRRDRKHNRQIWWHNFKKWIKDVFKRAKH